MVSNAAPEMTQVNDVPVGHAAIDGRVLAHRRDDNTVGQLESADPQRSKQNGHANFSLFVVEHSVVERPKALIDLLLLVRRRESNPP